MLGCSQLTTATNVHLDLLMPTPHALTALLVLGWLQALLWRRNRGCTGRRRPPIPLCCGARPLVVSLSCYAVRVGLLLC